MQYDTTNGGVLMPASKMVVGGHFDVQHIRKGKVIDEFEAKNRVVNEGLNKLLSVMFNGGAQVTTWYVSLFEGNYTPTAALTAANVTSLSTECTAYTATTRPVYDEAAPSGQSITNSANRASFVFTAAKTIYGAFLVSASAKSATSGTLFSAARFASAKSVETDDELLLTYTFSAATA